jgi:hypothetical protein
MNEVEKVPFPGASGIFAYFAGSTRVRVQYIIACTLTFSVFTTTRAPLLDGLLCLSLFKNE